MRLTNKRYAGIAGALMLMTAGVAYAANMFNTALYLKGGAYIGEAAYITTNSNKVTRALGATTAAIDFANKTITCEDSAGTTVTGVVTGDPCIVGSPSTGGSTNGVFTCYVSAADTVKVRHCAVGTADNPASATFMVRVFSSQ